MLYIAYIFNLIILVPICLSLYRGGASNSVFEGKFAASPELLALVGSLWTSILIASALGLIWPRFFAPVLLIQIIYKALFLIFLIWPLYRQGGGAAVPWGMTNVFIIIVATYPIILWLGLRSPA